MFPNFGTARTPYLIYDVYTNDSPHGVCFPTVCTVHVEIKQSVIIRFWKEGTIRTVFFCYSVNILTVQRDDMSYPIDKEEKQSIEVIFTGLRMDLAVGGT